MAVEERDHTGEWRIEPGRRPASVAELEGRIDTAIALAEAAEEAAMEIGAASLEAAEQARRAAELAESASIASQAAARSAAEAATAIPAPAAQATPATGFVGVPGPEPANGASPTARPSQRPARPDPFDERLSAFRERADRVLVRLRRLDAPTPIS
jgi:hypothetical protein